MHLVQLLICVSWAWVPPSVSLLPAGVNGTRPKLAVDVYGSGDTFRVEPGWHAVVMGGPANWSRDEHTECTGALFIYLPVGGQSGLQFRVRDPVAVATVGDWNGSTGQYVSGATLGFGMRAVQVVVTDRPTSCSVAGMGDPALRYEQASLWLDGRVLYLVSVWDYHSGALECVADTAVPAGDLATYRFRSWADEVSEKCVVVGGATAPAGIDTPALVAIVVSSAALALSSALAVYVLVRACTAEPEYRTPLTSLTEVVH
jgi:hypothetical protein